MRLPFARIATLSLAALMVACAGEQQGEKGESIFEVKQEKAHYGKVQHVDISGPIDPKMVARGKEVFDSKCSACHKYDERYVGPSLGKVTERRTPEYIMNMILDTETMIENDDTVMCLMQEFLMRMPDQHVDSLDARSVLEHLRDHASKYKK